jgi:hypothetical protein
MLGPLPWTMAARPSSRISAEGGVDGGGEAAEFRRAAIHLVDDADGDAGVDQCLQFAGMEHFAESEART